MQFSAAGLELLKQSEGFRNRTYLDVAGFPTIGYGHRLVHPECFPNGIDEAQAARILAGDVLGANEVLIDAYNSDVRPLLAEVRTEMGIDPDPLGAFARSGYYERVAAARVG